MQSAVKDLHKAQIIIGADYSEYPNPLRELLESRKKFYRLCKNSIRTKDIDAVIEFYEDQIKLLLTL